MNITCFRIQQWGYGEGAGKTPIYITVMSAKDLAKADIDRWTKHNKSGYQRQPKETRFGTGRGSIVRYLLDEMGAFPTSVLVNVRGSLKFQSKIKMNEVMDFGELTIPDEETLYIIDGQHRLEALKRATSTQPDLEDYPLPVSILNLKDKFDEMLHFYIVNSRQKKIPTDLVFKQLQMMVDKAILGGKEWLKEVILGPREERAAMATVIVDYLDEEPLSPFHGQIQYTGEPKEPHHLVKDYLLAFYLAQILKEKALSGMSHAKLAQLLADYWSAIKEIYPNCFARPDEYTLLKTTGVASYTYLFPTIFAYCATDADISKSRFKHYLLMLNEKVVAKELPPDFQHPLDEGWWSSAHGPSIASATSQKIFHEISKNMAKKIEIVMEKMKPNEA